MFECAHEMRICLTSSSVSSVPAVYKPPELELTLKPAWRIHCG